MTKKELETILEVSNGNVGKKHLQIIVIKNLCNQIQPEDAVESRHMAQRLSHDFSIDFCRKKRPKKRCQREMAKQRRIFGPDWSRISKWRKRHFVRDDDDDR